MASLAMALVLRAPGLWALTFVSGGFALLSLLAAPAVALSRSWQTDRRLDRHAR
ncbi:MAG: hypothetical protein U5R31_14450 [Acidimicrobiia bacterium]|nr:hypothetical protein [Acidimicrobiia bacterium]